MKDKHNTKLTSLLLSLAVAGSIPSGVAQELAPDDPSVAADLAVWFRDAAGTFDPGTGVWADSSGNDRHAVPVGEVDVNAPLTYVGPTASTTSGGAFSVDDVPAVRFSNDADDLLVAADLNGDVGLTDLTIFVVYNVDFLAANPNLTRPVGIGSVSGTQANPGNHFNLGSDPSIRKDNGQLGAGTYPVAFPPQTTLIRSARMSAASVDDWFNIDGTLQLGLNLTGVSYTTSVDDFFLGDLRCGNTPVPGFGAAIARADFDIVQTLAYAAALSDEQVAGINEWLANNLTGGSGGSGDDLAFTQIIVAGDLLSAELTWRSKPGKTYAVDLSTDLNAAWQEINDEVESAGGDTTSFTAPTYAGQDPPDPLSDRVFYRVRELD